MSVIESLRARLRPPRRRQCPGCGSDEAVSQGLCGAYMCPQRTTGWPHEHFQCIHCRSVYWYRAESIASDTMHVEYMRKHHADEIVRNS